MNLHDKVQEKRRAANQKNLDEGQDKQIKELKDKVDRMSSRDGPPSRSRSRRRRRSLDDREDDDYDRSAQRSRAMIEREFDENVRRIGDRYAQGDVIAENRLQAQIIELQQTVITVLQDALMNGRSLTKADIRRLIAAQDVARQGSLDALRDQYDRMLDQQRQRPLAVEYDSRPRSPPRRQLTLPAPVDSPIDDAFPPVRRVQTVPIRSGSSSPSVLHCRYAHDLQTNPRKPLSPAFSPTGSQRCPACDVWIPVSTNDVWVFERRIPIRAQGEDDLVEVRSFNMDPRLVVKSHTPSGDFACVLCYRDRERDADCVCSSVEALVRHLGRVHTSEEFESEEDMFIERR